MVMDFEYGSRTPENGAVALLFHAEPLLVA